MYSRLSNAFLVGMIIGMLLFGGIVDQLGRKTGAVATTLLLVLGIVLSTAASGSTPTGLLWMMVVARGIAGVGAGGEYPVSGAGATEGKHDIDQGSYLHSCPHSLSQPTALLRSPCLCLGFTLASLLHSLPSTKTDSSTLRFG